MNKKGIELTLTQIIGLVIVIMIFLGTLALVMKIVGILTDKPDQATINNMENLMHELSTIENNERKVVPFFLKEDYMLTSLCARNMQELVDDICICKESCMKKTIIKEFHDRKLHLKVDGNNIMFDDDKIHNLHLFRNGDLICISQVEISTCTE